MPLDTEDLPFGPERIDCGSAGHKDWTRQIATSKEVSNLCCVCLAAGESSPSIMTP